MCYFLNSIWLSIYDFWRFIRCGQYFIKSLLPIIYDGKIHEQENENIEIKIPVFFLSWHILKSDWIDGIYHKRISYISNRYKLAKSI